MISIERGDIMEGIRKIKPFTYFIHALVVFGFLGMEFGVLFVSRIIDGRSMEQLGSWPINWYGAIAHWVITIIVWGIGVAIYTRWAKRNGVFSELITFEFNIKVAKLTAAAVGIVVIMSLIQSQIYDISIPQLFREYRGFRSMYGEHALIVTIFQNIYYAFEMLLVLIMVVFFQRAGELWFKSSKVPWSSIGLMMTWGAIHFLSHPAGALGVTLWALVPGLFYVYGGRYFYPVYVLLLLGFMI